MHKESIEQSQVAAAVRRALCVLAMLLAVSGLSGCQRGSEYPNGPIVLLCPWSAGGGTDRLSRQVAAFLEREMDTPVNVVNATGGGGVTGHTRGALARPDGYTLTMVTVEINMLHWRGLTNISHKDYEPIGLVNLDAAAIFVRADAPWKNLAEFEEYVRTSTFPVKVSGTANGGIWHLALAGWMDKVGLTWSHATWVPNNGAAPSFQELLAGGVEAVCCSLPEAHSLLDSEGGVRCLGVMADKRVTQYSEVPTLKEQGVDWTMIAWRGVCAPKGTPPEITGNIVAALERVVLTDSFKESMRNAGFNTTWMPPERFRAHMVDVDERLGKLLTGEMQSIQEMWAGPMFFPAVLGALLAAVLLSLLATGGLRKDSGIERVTWNGLVRSVEIIAWVVVYVLLAEHVGFVITSAVLLAYSLWRLGNRWPVAIAMSAVVVPLAYQLFAVGLRVPLPRGWLGW